MISAAAVWVAVQIVQGIYIEPGLGPLFIVALIFGAVNAVVRPLLKSLACGLIFLTLGLFLLVINAAMLMLSGYIARAVGIEFSVDGFVPALIGSLVISVVTYVASMILIEED